MVPSRPALRYHGAKWALGPWVVSHLPGHECYVEPFGGSAGVLLQKARSWLEVYNDLDEEVVGFFQVMREQPERLITAIQWTPYARKEWELALEDDPDPVERARRFYVRAWMQIAGATGTWKSGWRRQKVVSKDWRGQKKMTPACVSFAGVEHLWAVADRLRGVQIECGDWQEVVNRYDSPETCFYVDPPYPASTRGRWKRNAYRHELSDGEHGALARALHVVLGKVVISGYRCELYDELYAGWARVERSARTNSAGSAVECLWLSPGAEERQLSLFGEVV